MKKTLRIVAGPIHCLQCDFKADSWDVFKEHLKVHRLPMFTIPNEKT